MDERGLGELGHWAQVGGMASLTTLETVRREQPVRVQIQIRRAMEQEEHTCPLINTHPPPSICPDPNQTLALLWNLFD